MHLFTIVTKMVTEAKEDHESNGGFCFLSANIKQIYSRSVPICFVFLFSFVHTNHQTSFYVLQQFLVTISITPELLL